jgi:hypothetical protein
MSLLDCSINCATFLWVRHAGGLQLDEDTEILAELLYIVIVLWVWYARRLQMDEKKEVPGELLSYHAAVAWVWSRQG